MSIPLIKIFLIIIGYTFKYMIKYVDTLVRWNKYNILLDNMICIYKSFLLNCEE